MKLKKNQLKKKLYSTKLTRQTRISSHEKEIIL
jgi:hypothetical protein